MTPEVVRDARVCEHCGTALPKDAHYCAECGTSADLVSFDPFHLSEPEVTVEVEAASDRRRGLWALAVLVMAVMGGLWWVSSVVETQPATEESASTASTSRPFEPTTTTEARSRTTTTRRTTTTTVPGFVGGTPGPVLGDEISGLLVQFGYDEMRHIDLATGAIREFDLEHPLAFGWGWPEPAAIIDGRYVQASRGRLIVTDLRTGVQQEPVGFLADAPRFEPPEFRVVGRAGPDSVWVANEPWPDGESVVMEVGLDGVVRNRLDLPAAAFVVRADGHELILETIDGWWRYDASAGLAGRMPAGVIASTPGFVLYTSCENLHDCEVVLEDREGDFVAVDVDPRDLSFSDVQISPDGRGLLVAKHSEYRVELSYVDLAAGTRIQLPADIDHWVGVTWIGDSGWIVGGKDGPRSRLTAMHITTGEVVEMELGRRDAVGVAAYLPEDG